MRPAAVVPAAGKGERFRASSGIDAAKLVALVNGEPLLDRTLRCLFDGGVAAVVVVLPPNSRSAFASSRLLDDDRVQVVVNPDPSRGMLSSIQVGLAAIEGHPVLVLPADMPFVRAETVAQVIDACLRTGRIVSPRYNGHRGHPLGLPAAMRADILRAAGASTLSRVLAGHERLEVDVHDAGILRDVDVAGDLSPPGS